MPNTPRELTLAECEQVNGGWQTAGGVGTASANGGLSQPYTLTVVFTITLGNGTGGGTYTAPRQSR
jgi:hypothetical protein